MRFTAEELKRLIAPLAIALALLGAGGALIWSGGETLRSAQRQLVAAQAERKQNNERLARIAEEEREVSEKIDVYQRLKSLNILGEEFLWRGVILPRQELAFGQYAWLANATGWLVFHLAVGWTVILLVTPIVFILPWIVQKRRNSSIGVIIHAALNGPAFIAVALGFA